ncbi:RICIN domain-containing protein, partial [Streptomyces sp. A7024]
DPSPSRSNSKPSRQSDKAAPPPTWSPAAADRVALPLAATGRCMDIAADEGAEPYETACDGGRSQRWELLVDRPAQEVRIRNYATGMCLAHSGEEKDGAPVRQRRGACRDDATTARWTYFRTGGSDRVAFAQKGSGLYFLGLDDWHAAAEGDPHDPDIGTTANYYNSPSLRFRYEGIAFGD